MKTFFKTLSILFSVTLILTAAAIAFVALPYFGNQALIVRSGSMMPTIDVGAVVIVRPTDNSIYNVGDVIAFRSEKNRNTIITHRVTEVIKSGNSYSYKTKGDANEEQDSWTVRGQNVLGASFLTVPYIGKVLEFAKSKEGFPIMIVTPAAFVILLELINIGREIRRKIKEGKTKKKLDEGAKNYFPSFGFQRLADPKPSLTGLKVLIPILFFGITIPTAFAFFSDTETSQNNIFQAAASFPEDENPIAQTLVINEVLPDTSCTQGNTEAQWIEVYNGFDFSVNLKDFQITDGVNTIDLVTANSIIVPPGGFALLAHNSAIWNRCYDDNDAITANLGGQLNIDVGLLQLLDQNDVIIDTVQWGNETGLNPIQNQSIERVPYGLDTALGANFNPEDFIVREMPTPGYGSTLVINELFASPSSGNEWVEIYNASSSAITLNGWTLDDPGQSPKSLTSLGTIDGESYVIYENASGWLNNTGDLLQLIDPQGRIIDQRTFGSISTDISHGRFEDRGNNWIDCVTASQGTSNDGVCQP